MTSRRRIEAAFAIGVEQAMAEAARDGGRLAKEMLLTARMPDGSASGVGDEIRLMGPILCLSKLLFQPFDVTGRLGDDLVLLTNLGAHASGEAVDLGGHLLA